MEAEYSRIKLPTTLITPPLQKPKIAFLFIARNRIPLDMVWDVFFKVIIWLVFTIFGLLLLLELILIHLFTIIG